MDVEAGLQSFFNLEIRRSISLLFSSQRAKKGPPTCQMYDLAVLDSKGQGNHPAKFRRRP
jgi:hypothetical protein